MACAEASTFISGRCPVIQSAIDIAISSGYLGKCGFFWTSFLSASMILSLFWFWSFLFIYSSCHLGCCGCLLSIGFLLQLLHFTIIPLPYALLPIAPKFLLDKKGACISIIPWSLAISQWPALLLLPRRDQAGGTQFVSQFENLFSRSQSLASPSFFLYSFLLLIYLYIHF